MSLHVKQHFKNIKMNCPDISHLYHFQVFVVKDKETTVQIHKISRAELSLFNY